MTGDLRFELALLVERGPGGLITLAELIERAETGVAWPVARLDDATLLFESDGIDHMPIHWVFGELDGLAPQFDAAAERLQAGELALVRPAVTDRLEADYLLAMPVDDHATLSLVRLPPGLSQVYPTDPTRGAELYDHVSRHAEELVSLEGRLPVGDFAQVPVDLQALVAALRREASLARQVVERAASHR